MIYNMKNLLIIILILFLAFALYFRTPVCPVPPLINLVESTPISKELWDKTPQDEAVSGGYDLSEIKK